MNLTELVDYKNKILQGPTMQRVLSEKNVLRFFVLIITIGYLKCYFQFWILGSNGLIPTWTGWADQSRYYDSVQAILRLDFSPDRHHYPLGYQFLALIPVFLFKHHGYGILNYIICIVTALCLYRIANYILPVTWSALSVSLIFLYDHQIIFVLTTPWTNNAVLGLFAIATVIFLRKNWDNRSLLTLGILAGLIVLCRPGDMIWVLPIYLFITGNLIFHHRWKPLLIVFMTGLLFLLGFFGTNYAIYGKLVSPYMAVASAYTLNLSGLTEKIFSLFFGGESAYYTNDPMLIIRFPWIIFYFAGLGLLVIQKEWKIIVIQFSAILGFLYTTSFSPIMPPTLKLFEGMRMFVPFLVFMGVPCFIFVQRFIYARKMWMVVTAAVLILAVISCMFGVYGIKRTQIETSVHTTVTESDVHFEVRNNNNKKFKYKQILLPGFVADSLSAAHSDSSIRIEDENGCFKTQKTHFGLSRTYGIAIPLVYERESSWVNISVSRKFLPKESLVKIPLVTDTEFCFLCTDQLKLDRQIEETYQPSLEGALINFAVDRPLNNIGDGWSDTEMTHTWTDGHFSRLVLPRAKTGKDLYLELVAASFGRQEIRIELNGSKLTKLDVNYVDFSKVGFLLPGKMLKTDDHNILDFHFSNARSPSSLGMNSDNRKLALALKRIVVSENELPSPSTNLVISLAGSRPAELLVEGWSDTEATHTWTNGNRAVVRVPSLSKASRLLQVTGGTPFGLSQRVEVFLNGQQVGLFTANDSSFKTYYLVLPESLILTNSDNVIVFNLPDAVSPAKLKLSQDDRKLGLAVKEIEISTIFGEVLFADSQSSNSANDVKFDTQNINYDKNQIRVQIPADKSTNRLILLSELVENNTQGFIRVLQDGTQIARRSVSCTGPSINSILLSSKISSKELVIQPSNGLKVSVTKWSSDRQ